MIFDAAIKDSVNSFNKTFYVKNQEDVKWYGPYLNSLKNERNIAHNRAIGKDLPSFSGSPEEWSLFIGNFNRTSELCGFSDEENLLRLQKSLKGDAKGACQSLMISPKNVKELLIHWN